jgi:hypothetical protein
MSTQAARPHPITMATRLVLAALVLIALVVLARRFLSRPGAQPRAPGGLKPLNSALLDQQAIPPPWLLKARDTLRDAETAERTRWTIFRQNLAKFTTEDRQRKMEEIRLANGDVLDALPVEVLARHLGNPDLDKRIQREKTLRSSRPENSGRLPWPRRRELYQQFAELSGLLEPPSLLTDFDDLTDREMAAAIAAAIAADKLGLAGLSQDQWNLLLRAGAFSCFNQLVSKWPE